MRGVSSAVSRIKTEGFRGESLEREPSSINQNRCATLTSERCFKRIGRVANLRISSVRPDYRDNVEPCRRLRDSVAAEVEFSGLGDLVLLGIVHLILRSRRIVLPGFHLDKDNRFSIPSDDIDLTHLAAEVANENFVPQSTKVLGRHVLAALAEHVDLRFGFEQRLQPIEHGNEHIDNARTSKGRSSVRNRYRCIMVKAAKEKAQETCS